MYLLHSLFSTFKQFRNTYIVFLVPVVAHDGYDGIVDKQSQCQDACKVEKEE